MIEPLDDDEREQLIRELVVERFGKRPRRGEESSQVTAKRRRVLSDVDKQQRKTT